MASRAVVEEKPSDEQWQDLCDEFGRPRKIRKTWDLRHLNPRAGWSPCAGEVMLLVKRRNGAVAYVSRRGCEDDWFLPMGRIGPAEPIAKAAKREAYEETGLSVTIESVPAIYLVDIHFKEWRLVRWHFLVRARSASARVRPIDADEIGSAGFFPEPQFNGSAYMRRWMSSILRYS